MKKTPLPFITKATLTIVMFISIGYLAILGKSILAPLMFALLVAFLLLPVARFLEAKLRFRRVLASIVTVILFISGMYGVTYFFILQLNVLSNYWPLLTKQVINSFHNIQEWIVTTFNISNQKQLDYVSQSLSKSLTTSASVLASTVYTLSSTLLFAFFTLIFTFFILNYRKLLFTFLLNVFETQHTEKVVRTVAQTQYIIKKYIIGLFLQAIIVSMLAIVTLSVLGVKYAILLGLIAGLFNIIPYIGIFSALFISFLITYAASGLTPAFIVMIAYVGIHILDSNVIMPLVVGKKVEINALFAFIGILLGEMLWGVSGMFLCIPYLAILKVIFEHVDGLQPWGYLLGGIERKIKRKKQNLSNENTNG